MPKSKMGTIYECDEIQRVYKKKVRGKGKHPYVKSLATIIQKCEVEDKIFYNDRPKFKEVFIPDTNSYDYTPCHDGFGTRKEDKEIETIGKLKNYPWL